MGQRRHGQAVRRHLGGCLAGLVLALLPSIGLPGAASAGGLTVTNTNDAGPGSLRQAILDANSQPGLDFISFSIGSGPQTISLQSELPAIADAAVLDGSTQPGFAGSPIIEINGAATGVATGLLVTAGHSTVRGLVINRFAGDGIDLANLGDDVVEGNYIGTDVTGTMAQSNQGNGVLVTASNNAIGGTTAGARNVISGNGANGVFIAGSGAAANLVQGNYFGLNADGTAGIGNGGTAGVLIIDASNNAVGGTEAGARNVISGNHHGVYVTGKTATGNLIQGNYIGTDASGRNAVGNLPFHGVVIDGASNNTVGGTAAGAGNVISGNGFFGVEVRAGFFAPHDLATGNLIQGNFIGTDVTGTGALGNGAFGVAITNTPNNTVGGTIPAARNVISGNVQAGVLIWQDGSTDNLVEGNYIGTDVTGTVGLSRPDGQPQFNGVVIQGSNNQIGGRTPGAGNVIAFQGNVGAGVAGASATGNAIVGNSIFANGRLGIDLGLDGVTANDRGDGDGGPNNLQNFPVITRAVATPVQVVVVGSVDTSNPQMVTIDIYANLAPAPGADPSGHGEGQIFLGSVTPNESGRFTSILPPIPAGTVISATATDAAGDTSEFGPDAVAGH